MSSFTTPLNVEWLDPYPEIGFWDRLIWGNIRARLLDDFEYWTELHPQMLLFRLSEMRSKTPWLQDVIRFDCKTNRLYITAPKGYVTDFATIPRPFWAILHPTDPRYGKAAVIHDILYSYGVFSKAWADDVFYEAMGVRGIPDFQRKVMLAGVRTFGKGAY